MGYPLRDYIHQPGFYLDEVTLAPAYITGKAGAANSVPLVWQASSLSYIALNADASGNLLTAGGGGGGGGSVTQGTTPWITDDAQLTLRVDASAGNLIYLGQAAPGSAEGSSVWRIQLIDLTSGVAIKWAGGASTFANAWSNRASLSYT